MNAQVENFEDNLFGENADLDDFKRYWDSLNDEDKDQVVKFLEEKISECSAEDQ